MVLLHKLSECLFNGTQNPAISKNHGQGVGIGVVYTPLLECNASGTGKGAAMKKKIIKIIIIIISIKNTHFKGCTRQFCLALTYL